LGTKAERDLEQLIHYVGGICRRSVDDGIKDAAIRRRAEAD
jgi:hypothetical protein